MHNDCLAASPLRKGRGGLLEQIAELWHSFPQPQQNKTASSLYVNELFRQKLKLF